MQRDIRETGETGTVRIEAPGPGGSAYQALAYGDGLGDNPLANPPRRLPAAD